MTAHANLGLVLLSLLGTLSAPFVRSESELEQCSQREGIRAIQQKCSEHGEALNVAETRQDDQEVCRHLYNGLLCVAEHVPWCFNLYFQVMSHYIHSPHRCHISQDQILQLQKLVAGPSEPEFEEETSTPLTSTLPSPTPLFPSDTEATKINSNRHTVAATNAEDTETGEIFTYLEAETNGTALYEDSIRHNLTAGAPATSDKNAAKLLQNLKFGLVCLLALIVVLLPLKLVS